MPDAAPIPQAGRLGPAGSVWTLVETQWSSGTGRVYWETTPL